MPWAVLRKLDTVLIANKVAELMLAFRPAAVSNNRTRRRSAELMRRVINRRRCRRATTPVRVLGWIRMASARSLAETSPNCSMTRKASRCGPVMPFEMAIRFERRCSA